MRMKTMLSRTVAGLFVLLAGQSAQAATVAETLPYAGTPDWTDIVFQGTSMTTNGVTSTLTTAQSRGVWFGWGSGYADPAPAWTPGNDTRGNHLSLTASFSDGATDWSAYFYDRTHYAAFSFNETGCSGNAGGCYGINLAPGQRGVTVTHGEIGGSASTFVSLDMAQAHTYEFLLKNGQVAYRVDGRVIFSGAAYQAALGNPLLVIGDGSGSSLTGRGSMTLYGLGMDNAPAMNTLVSTVPEPETYALMLAGLGLVAWSSRGRAPISQLG